MRKYLFIVLALLLVFGVANIYAAGIPTSIDAKNGPPEIWITEVYNNSSTAITSASVVIWDFDTSDVTVADWDDRCNWVATTTTDYSVYTAGVVMSPSLGGKSTGYIAIRGVVPVKVTAGGITAGHLVGTSDGGAGVAEDLSAVGTDEAILGVSIKATTGTFAWGGNDIGLIFVNPCFSSDE